MASLYSALYGLVQPGSPRYGPAKGTVSRVGAETLNETIYCVYPEIRLNIPERNARHRNNPNLLFTSADYELIGGNLAGINVRYEGAVVNQDNTLSDPVYTLRAAGRTEPIATHPNFGTRTDAANTSSLVGIAGGEGKDLAYFDPTSGVFDKFGSKSNGGLVGLESFLTGGLVYSVQRMSYSPHDRLNRLWMIDYPFGQVPYVSGDWMLTDAQQVKRGAFYELLYEWSHGGPKPINRNVYSVASLSSGGLNLSRG